MTPHTNIVIVEDDEGHAILIQNSLAASGVKNPIRHFRDGQAALDYFFERKPAPDGYVVLLDIRMPKIDGVEVLRRLKADAELKRIPVLMVTTTDDSREVERCHSLGCSGYIQKPVDYDKFAEAMRRIGLFVPLLLVPPVPSK